MAKRALITGILGQDSAFLSKWLLEKGYEVIGGYRQSSTMNTWMLRQDTRCQASAGMAPMMVSAARVGTRSSRPVFHFGFLAQTITEEYAMRRGRPTPRFGSVGRHLVLLCYHWPISTAGQGFDDLFNQRLKYRASQRCQAFSPPGGGSPGPGGRGSACVPPGRSFAVVELVHVRWVIERFYQDVKGTQLVFPIRSGLPERQSHDYTRRGTTSLFAALDTATGKVRGISFGWGDGRQ